MSPAPNDVEELTPKRRKTAADNAHLRYLRARHELQDQMTILQENTPKTRAIYDEIYDEIESLRSHYAAQTINPRIVSEDQALFADFVDLTTERMRNTLRERSDVLSVDLLVHELASKEAMLTRMGHIFVRGSKLAYVSRHLPQLGGVTRRVISRRRQASDRPWGPATTVEEVDPAMLESQAERVFNGIKDKMMAAVSAFSKSHPNENLHLYRLVFDKHSFTRTLENFFEATVLVKDEKLWLDADSHGLPIVGVPQDSTVEKQGRRNQATFNFNSRLFSVMQEAYGDDEPMIERHDYEEPESADEQ